MMETESMLNKESRTELLAGAGLAAGPQGFDVETLAQLATTRGWTWTTTPASTHQGRRGRWRASVFVPADLSSARVCVAKGSRGAGASEAEALEKALATALAREG
jgi:hypothetical protein